MNEFEDAIADGNAIKRNAEIKSLKRDQLADYRLEVFKALISIGCNPEAAARQAVAVSDILYGDWK